MQLDRCCSVEEGQQRDLATDREDVDIVTLVRLHVHQHNCIQEGDDLAEL